MRWDNCFEESKVNTIQVYITQWKNNDNKYNNIMLIIKFG